MKGKIAYICHPAQGHIDWGGALELLKELDKSYEVTVYSGNALKDRVVKEGIRFFDIGLKDIAPSNMKSDIMQKVLYHIKSYFFDTRQIVNSARRTIKYIERDGCDVILSDPYCHLATIVSQIKNIKHYAFVSPPRVISNNFRAEISKIVLKFQDEIRKKFGISELYLNKFYPVTHHSPLHNFNFSVRSFNITNKVRCVYLGGKKIEHVSPIAGGRMSVYYSTGTIFWNPEQIRMIKKLAHKNQHITFHITSGRGIFGIEKFQNVRLYRFADELLLFPNMNLIITQGGMGTVGEAIRSGVPILDIPVYFGNYAQGVEIQKFGNGIFLKTIADQKKFLESAFEELLSDSAYKKRAERLQKLFDDCYDTRKITRRL